MVLQRAPARYIFGPRQSISDQTYMPYRKIMQDIYQMICSAVLTTHVGSHAGKDSVTALLDIVLSTTNEVSTYAAAMETNSSSNVAFGNTREVGILGLALNPKRWTIGRLTSRAGEGWENKKGLPRIQRPKYTIQQKPLRS